MYVLKFSNIFKWAWIVQKVMNKSWVFSYWLNISFLQSLERPICLRISGQEMTANTFTRKMLSRRIFWLSSLPGHCSCLLVHWKVLHICIHISISLIWSFKQVKYVSVKFHHHNSPPTTQICNVTKTSCHCIHCITTHFQWKEITHSKKKLTCVTSCTMN